MSSEPETEGATQEEWATLFAKLTAGEQELARQDLLCYGTAAIFSDKCGNVRLATLEELDRVMRKEIA